MKIGVQVFMRGYVKLGGYVNSAEVMKVYGSLWEVW